MVFCDFAEKKDNKLFYFYGETERDITGIFSYDIEKDELEIIKEPNTRKVPHRHIISALTKHSKELLSGQIPEHMDYVS